MLTRQNTLWIALLLGCVSLLHAQSGLPDRCGNSPLPFATIEVKRNIDTSCGLKGNPTASHNSQIQNEVKNNFCAAANNQKPETFSVQMLVDLQKRTHIASGYQKEPSDRSALQALGEGKLVRIKAYFFEAHHADLGGGESVNCNGGGELENDVHMALVAQANAPECESVTAEISPHYRPDSWDQIGHDEKYDSATKVYTPDPRMEALLKGHVYRITGQLFFDASHSVCPCGVSCTPVRASLWEIHPVYIIEVCKPNTQCDESNDGDWLAFDKWWSSNPAPGSAPVARKPHKHPSHELRPSKSGN